MVSFDFPVLYYILVRVQIGAYVEYLNFWPVRIPPGYPLLRSPYCLLHYLQLPCHQSPFSLQYLHEHTSIYRPYRGPTAEKRSRTGSDLSLEVSKRTLGVNGLWKVYMQASGINTG